MKTLIVAINSKYIHSCLSAWYLKACCGNDCGDVEVFESTINDNPEKILMTIYAKKPDVVSISCYIWNIEMVVKLCKEIKKVLANVIIILGGPEVSYESVMPDNVDYVIQGEGESAFKTLMEFLFLDTIPEKGFIPGIPVNLDLIPSPYTEEMMAATKNKITYFESQRGCPYKCSYCLSSVSEGVRYFSVERVKKDLKLLIDSNVTQIKFVDRTFNCNKERAKEIFKFIIENAGTVGFHFEVAADLFDDEMFEILKTAPVGLIQFEAGIQTVNEKTLDLINRKTDTKVVLKNIEKLLELKNIHVHVDLIAGLPGEDFASFKNSFNVVYNLKPHMLQLGFLKMLKGTNIRTEAAKYDYKYRSYPPYEILYNNLISFEEISYLKETEELVERFYNSGRFVKTIEFMISKYYKSPFEFFADLRRYLKPGGYFENSISLRSLYTLMSEYSKTICKKADVLIVNELLKYDFLSSDNSKILPDGIERDISRDFNQRCFDFLKDVEKAPKYLPFMENESAKSAIKHLHFETFKFKFDKEKDKYEKKDSLVIFNCNDKDVVTGLYDIVWVDNQDF